MLNTFLIGVVLLITQIYIILLPTDKFSNLTLKIASGFVGIGYMVYVSKLMENL
jgi:hypothetical protein